MGVLFVEHGALLLDAPSPHWLNSFLLLIHDEVKVVVVVVFVACKAFGVLGRQRTVSFWSREFDSGVYCLLLLLILGLFNAETSLFNLGFNRIQFGLFLLLFLESTSFSCVFGAIFLQIGRTGVVRRRGKR